VEAVIHCPTTIFFATNENQDFLVFFSFIIKLKKQIKKRTQIIGIGGKLSFMGFQVLILKIFFNKKFQKSFKLIFRQ